MVRFAKSGEVNQDGVVIEGPEANNGNNFHLRKDSVESEGITSVTSVNSSLPCSNSLRIMPIYEEAIMSASEASPQTLRPGALTLSSLRRKSVSWRRVTTFAEVDSDAAEINAACFCEVIFAEQHWMEFSLCLSIEVNLILTSSWLRKWIQWMNELINLKKRD